MHSAVDRILEGNFNTDDYILDFSTPVIELCVNAGEKYEGEFAIYGPKDVYTEGTVSSSGLRMQCPVSEFSGSESLIPYIFDASAMQEGDEYKGEFRIISNHGEYLVPYAIKIGNENLDTSLGNIKNLFHFTNLARTNWDEAVKLFCSYDFELILNGADRLYLNVYRALNSGENIDQNLEEFLLNIKKKQPAEFIVDEPNVRIESVSGQMEKHVLITRNGWGYSNLSASTNDDFIVLHSDEIRNNDFIGNVARLSYSIIEDKLHEGRNYGKIVLKNAYNEINISICVLIHPVNRRGFDVTRATKHAKVDIMHYYEAFRCRKISSGTWLKETSSLVDSLIESDRDNPYYQLMHAQLLVTEERYNEARWIVEQLEPYITDTEDSTLYCYYYYLTTLVNRNDENTAKVSELVEHIYHKDMSDWRTGWLLMYLSEDYLRAPQKRWDFLCEQFRQGSTSPVIYVEAYQILQSNPTILNALTRFEIQVLRYMAKKDILTPDVIEQFIYLFNRNRNYKKSMIPLLKYSYGILPTDDVLKALTVLLINLGDTSNDAFAWYSKAIEKGLKVTKLYEFYMMSIDMDASIEIPKMVLMYFAFDSSLDTVHNSYLYSYIYRNKALFPELYDNYKENIDRFVSFEILKGNNNKYLAYLLKNMVSEHMITEELSKGLFKSIFTHLVTLKRNNIKTVILRYANLECNYAYPVSGREVYLPIYGSNYQIILMDNDGNSFATSDEYEITRLMMPDKIAGYIAPFITDEILLDLFICEHGRELQPISVSNVSSMNRLADSDMINSKLRKEIKIRLIRFYYDEDMMDELDLLLDKIEPEEVSASYYSEVINTMVLRGMYEKAYDWIGTGGGENIEIRVIQRLCTRIISSGKCPLDIEDPIMVSLVYRTFMGGKYDELTLKYLVRHFDGTCKEMREIWKCAKDFGINVTLLEEHILEQMLYSNAYIPEGIRILEDYDKSSPFSNLTLAVLVQYCYDYFVCDKIFDDTSLTILQRFIDDDRSIPLVCKLAYTKYYSEDVANISDKVSRILVVYLRELLGKDMYFPYFKEYADVYTFMHRFLDKTIVEYRAEKGKSATIHYMLEKNQSYENEYAKEEMKEMFCGIYVKMFVLFFGERMQYYIVENDGSKEQLNESGSFSRNDTDERTQDSKYSLINDIAIARTLGDYGTLEDLLLEYYKYDYLLNTLFKMSE